ncbi:hypothetical protein DFH27DRAFT_178461 [Peziza echinospora]|nr:hypothetical protein DFH27DRAFT_178461 [Peziza echinospora]
MALRDIRKSRSTVSLGSAAPPTAEPPSPTLSAVNASTSSKQPAATSTSSEALKQSLNADTPSSNQEPVQEVEDLTQSRWFPRTWPRKTTAPAKVAPDPIPQECPPPAPPEPETTTILAPVQPLELASELGTTTSSAATLTTDATVEETENQESDKVAPVDPVAASTWLGWLWGTAPQQAADTTAKPKEPEEPSHPEIPAEVPEPEPAAVLPEEITNPQESTATPEISLEPPTPPTTPARGSWFGYWGAPAKAVVPPTIEEETTTVPIIEPAADPLPEEAQPADTGTTEVLGQVTEDPNPKPPATAVVSSGWGFWYRGGIAATASTTTVNSVDTDAAVAQTPATPQTKNMPGDTTVVAPTSSNNTIAKQAPGVAIVKDQDRSGTSTPTQSKPTLPPPPPSTPTTNKIPRICPPNHVFPSFDSCYDALEPPTLLAKLKGKLTKYFIPPPPPISTKHLYIKKTPRRIKKAVAIGVHGFFPMRLVRSVLGEPTGTSVRFAESAAAAIQRWAEANGVEVEIEKVALEGEGKVADRVETLWKLLENWMEHVRNADFVMIAAHSQGVVVGLQLLARMIEQGCVDNARVGFAAMAGINLGPFYHLPTSILTGSAKELFEFQRSDSLVSKKYIQALRIVLAHHTRIVFIGSIDDQLVPLESSTFSNIHHPYIYRAVFVDGRVHAPDFLSHLVGFAMKLRNLGISDHGIVRELSTPLAGSLYGGEGHSRIYDDGAVYDIAVRHALETSDCPEIALKVDPWMLPTNVSNPFVLPWAVRGLLEEQFVRERLSEECHVLLKQFEEWKPQTKVLKDVKFRLEGIRSKL